MAALINRRTCLKGTCALLSLPLLEAMRPGLFASEPKPPETSPKPRLLFIDEIGNGVDNVRWYPTKLGREWEITETLRPLAPFRDQVTVLSGLRQTHDDNGHLAADTFLTGAKATNNAVSVDQVGRPKSWSRSATAPFRRRTPSVYALPTGTTHARHLVPRRPPPHLRAAQPSRCGALRGNQPRQRASFHVRQCQHAGVGSSAWSRQAYPAVAETIDQYLQKEKIAETAR